MGKNLKLPTSDPQVGFIAQELKAVLPEAVTTADGPEAIMSVQESKVVPVLVEAVKELKAAADRDRMEVELLKATNAARIRQLKASNAAAIKQLQALNKRYMNEIRQLKAANDNSDARLRKIEDSIVLSSKNIKRISNTVSVNGR